LALVKKIDFKLMQEECMKPISDIATAKLHMQLIDSIRLFLLNSSTISKRREILDIMIDQDFLGMNEVKLFL
jgi:hypothetical protein